MSINTQDPSAKHELASLDSLRELAELQQIVSRIPNEKYWEWAESPEGIDAMVDLIAGTLGDALRELETL